MLRVVSLCLLLLSETRARLYFSNCNAIGWRCDSENDVVYSCRSAGENDVAVHLKDFHTGTIKNLTIQNCNNVKLYTDCPQLAFPSYLQHLTVKDSNKLEFSLLSEQSLKQTPSALTLENLKEILSVPKDTFKSPSNALEFKCFGSYFIESFVIRNSNIEKFESQAFYNVSGVKRIEFENVTIGSIEDDSIEALMNSENSQFIVKDCKIDRIKNASITVNSRQFVFTSNIVNTISSNGINVTSFGINFTNNTIEDIEENGLNLSSAAANISNNFFRKLGYQAMINSKCLNLRYPKYFYFVNNTIGQLGQYSIHFNIGSCQSLVTPVRIRQNTIENCLCQNVSWLIATDERYSEISSIFLDKESNNTCRAPCVLPVEVVRTMSSNRMCQLNLAPQVMCYVYYDRRVNGRIGSVISNDVITDASGNDDVAEPTAAFYLIRQAPESDASVNFLDKDEIMKDQRLNMTNRTTIRMAFDASTNFEETLRHTNASHGHRLGNTSTVANASRRPLIHSNNCAGASCNNSVSVNKQKALDFYKYLYAQLHNDSVKT